MVSISGIVISCVTKPIVRKIAPPASALVATAVMMHGRRSDGALTRAYYDPARAELVFEGVYLVGAATARF